ncbi:hypothetical protein B0T11DRAFT_278274, partial [Plectosphaerella cucumerina]
MPAAVHVPLFLVLTRLRISASLLLRELSTSRHLSSGPAPKDVAPLQGVACPVLGLHSLGLRALEANLEAGAWLLCEG